MGTCVGYLLDQSRKWRHQMMEVARKVKREGNEETLKKSTRELRESYRKLADDIIWKRYDRVKAVRHT